MNASEINFKILELLHQNHRSLDFVTLLNEISECHSLSPLDSQSLLTCLRTRGLIEGSFEAYSSVTLTDKGVMEYIDLKAMYENQPMVSPAKTGQHRKLRKDKSVALTDAFSTIVNALSKLIVSAKDLFCAIRSFIHRT